MNSTIDIKGEHAVIAIILDAMKKLALDMRIGKFIDSYRIVQILDFLHTYTEHCHYEKEEKCIYPALLESDIPWTADTISQLIVEHKLAYGYINEINALLEEYLTGNVQIIESLSSRMIKYVELGKRHIKIVDTVLLPLCDKVFDADKLKSVSKDLKKIHRQNIGHQQEYYQLLEMIYAENDRISESVY